ncbi:sugar porter family MFS transporter [Actinocorallia populi]|uniref:sugar porter family MFS transporter n=1 Tax=Actinocorallia populi TaxID=2079200 RepID=UPI000D08A9E8|nr:sugar porter family MFS transporter [Actinocorallia populi]
MADAPGAPDGPPEVPAADERRIRFWAVLIAVGGFLFGFDTGVISGALLFIKTEFRLNAFEQGSVVSVLVLGAMAGSLAAGRIADRIGRRRLVGLEGLVFLAGTLIAVLSADYLTLMAARLVLGLAVGAASATVPPYLSEISPKEIRGRLLSLNQLMITVGILAAYVINLVFSGSGNWRAMIGAGAVPALLMVASSLWILPESPAWLAARGGAGGPRRLHGRPGGGATVERVVALREEERREETRQDRNLRTGWGVLLDRAVRPALVVGLVLAAAQQFGGINTIIYYAPTIIEQTGLTASNAIFYSIAIGVINLAATLVALRLIDRAGRRALLLFSFAVMTATMGLLGLSLVLGWHPVVTLVFMVMYISGYAVGVGPVFWTLIGEVFPPQASAVGAGVSTAVNWTSNFAVTLVFLSVVQAIGEGQTFWIFAVVSGLALLFSARFVPETKDRDFPAIDSDLRTRFGRP